MANNLMFLNIHVENVTKTREFISKLGFNEDAKISNEDTASFVINDQCWLMCLENARFQEFAAKPLSNEQNTTSMEIAISAESREEVDKIVTAAMEAGATPARDAIDEGFMYGRSFHDLDGYLWAVMWMDVAAAFGDQN